MVKRAASSNLINAKDCVRALPRSFPVGDYFTGAATFAKLTDAILLALHDVFPEETKGLEAIMLTKRSVGSWVLKRIFYLIHTRIILYVVFNFKFKGSAKHFQVSKQANSCVVLSLSHVTALHPVSSYFLLVSVLLWLFVCHQLRQYPHVTQPYALLTNHKPTATGT